MATLNNDGLKIGPQDLSTAAPSADDDGRLFNHDGSSQLTLTDGSTTSNKGFYRWDDAAGAWSPMKATITDADQLDGMDSSEFLHADGSVAATGNLNLNDNDLVNLRKLTRPGTTGPELLDIRNGYLTGQWNGAIYQTEGGGSAPFGAWGNLVIQPRSTAARDIILAPTGADTDGDGNEDPFIGLKADRWGDVYVPNGNVEVPNGQINFPAEDRGFIEVGIEHNGLYSVTGTTHQMSLRGRNGLELATYDGSTGTLVRDIFARYGDVDIPNGRLNLGGVLDAGGDGILLSTEQPVATSFSDTFTYDGYEVPHYSLLWRDEFSQSGPTAYLSGYNGVRLFASSNTALYLDSNQNANIPNGHLDLANRLRLDGGAEIHGDGTWTNLDTFGTGIRVFDTANSQAVLRANEGGLVEAPNGALHVKSNPVVVSSTGTEYDIQKNGIDGAGIINFKT